MLKMITVFLIVFSMFFIGIQAVNKYRKIYPWKLTKTAAYATLCASLAIMLLTFIYIVF